MTTHHQAAYRPTACTTPATSTTPVASRSSRAWTTSRPTRSSSRALTALENLEHRGADGRRHAHRRRRRDPHADARRASCARSSTSSCRRPGSTAWRCASCRATTRAARKLEELLELQRRASRASASSAGATCPIDEAHVGTTANALAPDIRQLFIARRRRASRDDQDAFERKLYVIRRIVRAGRRPGLLRRRRSPRARSSTRGCSSPTRCAGFYPDLQDERFASAMALVHSRFSTNTFPSWELAHPFRVIAHNGEINTLMGNVNWMRARESQLASELFGERPAEGHADRAPRRVGLGDVRQRPRAAHARPGRSLPHAVMMMIPEAYADRDDLPDDLKGFYAFHSCLMEPWDGPAAVRLHRRPRRRRDARPQRPAPRPLAGDRRRLRHARLRGRPARHPAGATSSASAACSRASCSSSTSSSGRIVEDEEVKREVADPAALRRVVRRATSSTSTTSRRAHVTMTGVEPLRSASWPSATRRRTCAS